MLDSHSNRCRIAFFRVANFRFDILAACTAFSTKYAATHPRILGWAAANSISYISNMDGISLGGIATLFTSCIECFEYFKAASDLRRSYEILLVKLEIQKERLLVWGDVVGIDSDELDSVEKDQTLSGLTKRCLSTIRSLLQDTEILKSRYGLCPVTSSDKAIHRTSVGANALKRFGLRSRQTPQGPSALDKTRWAIHDAAKFETLITHLKDLIDGLIARVPAPME